MYRTIIKNARLKANLTQKQVGNMLGVADTTISSYEKGKTKLDIETFIEILKICNFDIFFVDKNVSNEEIITLEKMKREY